MSANKRQHYVPQFYLKFFSNRLEETHLGLYVKKTKKYIKEATLSSQACENFFYGEDAKLEKGLSDVEGSAHFMMNVIIRTKTLPSTGTIPYDNLRYFTFIQASRTKHKAKQLDEMINKTIKTTFKNDPNYKEYVSTNDFGFENSAVAGLVTLLEKISVTDDLHCKLLINSTKVPFITSDHPVVKYNQFLEKRKFSIGITGLAAKGLQLFYPLTSELMLAFYDSKVYKYGNRKDHSVLINHPHDVNELNLLQFINSDQVVYFNEKIDESYIECIHADSQRFSKDSGVEIKEYQVEKNLDGSGSFLLQVTPKSITTNMHLSFVGQTKYAKQYKLTGYALELRNENWRYDGTLNP